MIFPHSIVSRALVPSVNYVVEDNKIAIYPHPALGVLNLEYPSSIRMLSLSLTDVKGRKIREFNRITTELDVKYRITTG